MIRLKRRVAALEGYIGELGDAFNNNARINREVMAALELRTGVLYRLAADACRGEYYLTEDGEVDLARYEAEYCAYTGFADFVATWKLHREGLPPAPDESAVIFGD